MKEHASKNIPRTAYRLQFNEAFTLRSAIDLVPYLSELGVSHIYASPLLKAAPHSTHGYDVCDFTHLNPELGTEADLVELVETLHRNRMGLIVDIVPNHMGIATSDNRCWWDVLMNGPASRYASYFDIDWNSPDARSHGKVLVPVLSDFYHRLLRQKKIQLRKEDGIFSIHCQGQSFPINPVSIELGWKDDSTIESINSDPGALNSVLDKQFYRLTHWRNADTELNYRRFFAVGTLAAVAVEKDEVFHDTHRLVLDWVKKGWVDGLRIDHPDGLRQPQAYLNKLRESAPRAWVVVEKILQSGELLPNSWPIDGTTGYDFISRLGLVFINSDGCKALTEWYRNFTGELEPYEDLARSNKLVVLRTLFRTEVDRLSRLLLEILGGDWCWVDFPRSLFRELIEEMAASFPVYRTYICPSTKTVSGEDEKCIAEAVNTGRQHRQELPIELFDLFRNIMCLKITGELASEFVLRFQQLTVAATAKGVEDTTFYSFNRFVALNEVGGDPGRFGGDIAEFHKGCLEQKQHWPNSMLDTSTHDTKRSEDVRARLFTISEIPELWIAAVQRWTEMNQPHRTNQWPDRNAEYFFYQTLAGAWPLSVERAIAYMEKASNEAKQHTDWNDPNEAYGIALRGFVTKALGNRDFIRDLEQFLLPVIEAGYLNSLAQTLLKLTLPGVPDIYQGTELWDLSLVDPDNRRHVDFGLRRALLKTAGTMSAAQAWEDRRNGTAKIWLIQRVLALRSKSPGVFEGAGDYEPMYATGKKAPHILAFMRHKTAIVIIPRLSLVLKGQWDDTGIELPSGRWEDAFTGREYQEGMGAIPNLLRDFPVALLMRKDANQ